VDYSRHLEYVNGVDVSLDGIANDGEPNERDNALNDEQIYGTWANDRLTGNDQANLIYGKGGLDTIIGGDGDDTLKGEYAGDYIDAGAGNDLLDGMEGNDTLIGGPGRDAIFGGEGNDTIKARDFELDEISGGPGNDRALIDRNIGLGRVTKSDTVLDVEVTSDKFI
jgi:hypothetical protein